MHLHFEAVAQEVAEHDERVASKSCRGRGSQISLSYFGHNVEIVRINPARAANDLVGHQRNRSSVREASQLSQGETCRGEATAGANRTNTLRSATRRVQLHRSNLECGGVPVG